MQIELPKFSWNEKNAIGFIKKIQVFAKIYLMNNSV